MTTRAIATSLLLASLIACKSQADRDREHRDFPALVELRAKVENLSAIEKDARERAAAGVTVPRLPETGASSCIYLDPPNNSFGRPSDPSIKLGFECRRRARSRPGDVTSSHIAECNEIRWVVVVKPRELSQPVIQDGKSFRPGSFEYDALVYSFADGSHVGGVALRATNSSAVEARLGDGADDRLLLDLQRNACTVAQQALGLAN